MISSCPPRSLSLCVCVCYIPCLQVCQATLQLIGALLQCPLSAVFLRELVFGGSIPHLAVPPTSTASTLPTVSHTHTPSPHTPSPHTPPSHTVTQCVPENSIARERKKLEDAISRCVSGGQLQLCCSSTFRSIRVFCPTSPVLLFSLLTSLSSPSPPLPLPLPPSLSPFLPPPLSATWLWCLWSCCRLKL